MLRKILRQIRGTRIGYNIGRTILLSPFIAKNKLYDSAYNKKIKRDIERMEKNPPVGVHIATTNYCNAACIMCPHHKLKKFGVMNMKLYKKIIDNCTKLKIKYLIPSFFGEPLIDKHLIERIKYAKSKGMDIGFSSNASLFSAFSTFSLRSICPPTAVSHFPG